MTGEARQPLTTPDLGGRAAFFLYKQVLSPLLHAVSASPGACRFQPTCSEYAVVAVETHGVLHGGWLALRRLSRCHPLHPPAFDPVPMQSSRQPVTIDETAFRDQTPAPSHAVDELR